MFKVTDLVSFSTMFYLTIVNKTRRHTLLFQDQRLQQGFTQLPNIILYGYWVTV